MCVCVHVRVRVEMYMHNYIHFIVKIEENKDILAPRDIVWLFHILSGFKAPFNNSSHPVRTKQKQHGL